jgi:hypothetical protein
MNRASFGSITSLSTIGTLTIWPPCTRTDSTAEEKPSFALFTL